MDNIDLDINNYTQKELQRFLKLEDTYSNDELNSQISKFILKIVDNSYPNNYKEKLIYFINNVKDKLQIKNNKDNNNNNKDNKYSEDDKDTNYTKILSEIIDTKIGDIIKTYGNFNHNPLQYQRISPLTINSYNEKTISTNYIFNTRFRNNFLNSIPQQCMFQLPESINNDLKITLLSIQIPNVMLAFSSSKFTTQIYIKEDVTNCEAVVVIPDGNYDEITFPDVLKKCINEQVINPFILPINYRFDVTIDPHTFFVTISNSVYTFTMRTITKYPDKLGKCNLSDNVINLGSSNLTVYQTYNQVISLIDDSISGTISLDYNTKNTVSDLFLEKCIFKVTKNYTDITHNNLDDINFTLDSTIKGSLVLDYDLNKLLDIIFKENDTEVLYVPLNISTNQLIDNSGNTITQTIWSVDYTPTRSGYTYYRHTCLMNANLLASQKEPLEPLYTNNGGSTNATRQHKYSLKIYINKQFELTQQVTGKMKPTANSGFYKDFPIYDNLEQWINHNINNVSIGHRPFSLYNNSSSTVTTSSTSTKTIYSKEYTLYQMMTGNIFISHDSAKNYLLNIDIIMRHNPYLPLLTFPAPEINLITSTIESNVQNIQRELTCKEKITNLSDAYNFRFNDLDIKNKVSETSISNTLGYQIGYRSIEYAGQKKYVSESAFDKTSLDYVYFCLDDYNNSYLNHNYGVLPSEHILDKNILAVVTIRSPQFTTTFDNGSDYIPKLRYYLTPVNIKKIKIKLLDPLGNLLDINTNDYSFVLEVTKLMDITNK